MGWIRVSVEQFFKEIKVAFNKSEGNFIAVLEGDFLVLYISKAFSLYIPKYRFLLLFYGLF